MRSPIVEQVLNSTFGVEWEYLPSVPLSQINRAKSLKNQVRFEPLSTERVREYRTSMENGDQFPAPVLFPDGKEYVTSDGNHRNEAKVQLKWLTTDAYVVLCDDPIIRTALTYEWNRVINGGRPTEDETDAHVIALLNLGMKQKDVAREQHVSTKRVEEIHSEDKGHTRAMDLGIKGPWAKIESRYGRVRLHRDIELDSVFVVAVKLAARFGFTGKQIRDLTAELALLRSEAEKINFLASRTKDLQRALELQQKASTARRRGGPGLPPHKFLLVRMDSIKATLDGDWDKTFSNLNHQELQAVRDKVADLTGALRRAEVKLGS